jgi:hypothetical protein
MPRSNSDLLYSLSEHPWKASRRTDALAPITCIATNVNGPGNRSSWWAARWCWPVRYGARVEVRERQDKTGGAVGKVLRASIVNSLALVQLQESSEIT